MFNLVNREIQIIKSFEESALDNYPYLECVVAEKDCNNSLSSSYCTHSYSYICVNYINE
jgi:hypothetical protein